MAHNNPDLHKAESVSIDFGDQKSEVKDKTVSQDSNLKRFLNPVRLFANTIRQLQSYPGYSNTWSIFTFHNDKSFSRLHLVRS